MSKQFNQVRAANQFAEEVKIQAGPHLRARREAYNLTIEKLAEHIGISTNFLGDLERSIKFLSLSTALKLSWYFGCTVDELLGASINYHTSVNHVSRRLESLGLTGENETGFILSVANTLHDYIQLE